MHNAQLFIKDTINSILVQTYKNWELIIVNDGSSDDSLSEVKKITDNRMQVYTIENSGAAFARNFGFKKASGQFIKFIDADDLINPDMINSQLEIAKNNQDCIISGKWGRFYSNDIGTFKLNPEECWKDMKPLEWIYSSWKENQSMTQPGIFLIPRTIIHKAGLWNEKLSLIDDFDFFTRIILSSNGVLFCENAILSYRSGSHNTLSGLKSRKGAESEFLAISLATATLLKHSTSDIAKRLSAKTYATFIYNNYPQHKDLIKLASQEICKLGEIDFSELLPEKYRLLARIIGWKNIKRLQFYKNEFFRTGK